MKKLLILFTLTILVSFSTSYSQKKKKKTDTAKVGEESAKPKRKAYNKVITGEAITKEGLITFHQVDDNYYFEIPSTLLEKEILIVSRISGHVKGLNFGGAGMKSRPQQVIRFQKKDHAILVRSVSYNSVANENEPIYQSVIKNNFEPIIHSFKIETVKGAEEAFVVDIKGFFTSDIPMIGALSESQRKNFKVTTVDKSRSVINYVKSFPTNTEVRHILTYKGTNLPDNVLTNTLSIEMNQSLILLPEDPMIPRLHDERVGFFSIRLFDYSADEQRAAKKRYITKWRLEPSDWEAFNRGELVEPVKPIVYYVDPATPEEWKPFIKQGVEDWQTAFEKAGFKNAILAKDPPSEEEDPDWSPEDVRYSVIRYITTDIQNAQGPHVHDPRTGEILESDILWYHNVMNLLRNWYFVQTAAVNSEARKVKFSTEEMGELIRFVSAHEVGHTLGFPHNMGSSVAYSVDSLRSPTFTATHGTAPSIMDYARFNYIAQPGDGVTNFYPQIGEYDDWAIYFGYRPIPNIEKPEDEKEILHQWVLEKADNPLYRFGSFSRVDPSSQTEDLGDDSMNASELGIENLKRINKKLLDWAITPGEDYDDLSELYANVLGQFNRYMGHVTTNVGGIYEHNKTADQDGVVYTNVSAEKQKRAIEFLNKQLFETPEWLIDKEILGRTQESGVIDRVHALQTRTLDRLFDVERLKRVIENETLNGVNSYSSSDLMTDLRRGIFSELRTGKGIDTYRRNLQKAFIEKLGSVLNSEDNDLLSTDLPSLSLGQLTIIKSQLTSAFARQRDDMSKLHLEYLDQRIAELLDPSE